MKNSFFSRETVSLEFHLEPETKIWVIPFKIRVDVFFGITIGYENI